MDRRSSGAANRDVEPIAEMTRRLSKLFGVDEEEVVRGVVEGMRRNQSRASYSRVAARLEACAGNGSWNRAMARLVG